MLEIKWSHKKEKEAEETKNKVNRNSLKWTF